MIRSSRGGDRTTGRQGRGRVRRWWPGIAPVVLVAVAGSVWALAGAAGQERAPVVTAAAAATPVKAAAAAADKMAICTFTNPSYAGECVEGAAIPEGSTAMKACLAILDCLNNARCAKTYCDATTIRIGWELKSAEEE
jgi:hypothetical protein